MKRRFMGVRQPMLAVALAFTLASIALVVGLAPAAAATGPENPSAAATPAPKKAAPAKAAPVKSQGTIALMPATGGDILLLNPATGKLQRVTNGMDPAISPDGTKLAFTRLTPTPGMFVRDLKTGEERKVVSVGKPRHPTWSPDGQKLAFVHLVETKTCFVSVLGCLTREEVSAVFRGADCIKVQGTEVCVGGMPPMDFDLTGIAAVDLNGNGWQDLPAPRDAQSPSWRPNGQDLLFRGSNKLQLTAPGAQQAVDIVADQWWGSPSWSPDGTKFVAQKRIHDHTDIGLFDSNGKLIKYLTAPPSALRRSPHNVAPAWSADGKTILFLTDREGQGTWKLYRMNADGTGQAPFMPNVLKGVTFKYDFAAERVASWGK